MTIEQWQASGTYFTYKNAHQIFYRTAGDGEALLLLHGFPTASWDWWKIWEELAEHFYLIAPDFIGFGFSDKPKRYAYSIHDQADLVEALLEKLKVERLFVLAHDYGDTVLQELMARAIEREAKQVKGPEIQSVVMLNGGLFPEKHYPRPIQKALISPIGFFLLPFINKRTLDKNFAFIFGKDSQASPSEIDSFYALIEYNNGKYIFHKLIRYMAERRQYRERWVEALRGNIPIRLINGAVDPVSGKHLVEHYKTLVTNPDVVSLPTIGHYPQVEAPKEVLESVLAYFLNRT